MPELLADGLPLRPRRNKFDFTQWADGRAWRFVKGQDYESSTETFRTHVRRWAKANGYDVELRPTWPSRRRRRGDPADEGATPSRSASSSRAPQRPRMSGCGALTAVAVCLRVRGGGRAEPAPPGGAERAAAGSRRARQERAKTRARAARRAAGASGAASATRRSRRSSRGPAEDALRTAAPVVGALRHQPRAARRHPAGAAHARAPPAPHAALLARSRSSTTRPAPSWSGGCSRPGTSSCSSTGARARSAGSRRSASRSWSSPTARAGTSAGSSSPFPSAWRTRSRAACAAAIRTAAWCRATSRPPRRPRRRPAEEARALHPGARPSRATRTPTAWTALLTALAAVGDRCVVQLDAHPRLAHVRRLRAPPVPRARAGGGPPPDPQPRRPRHRLGADRARAARGPRAAEPAAVLRRPARRRAEPRRAATRSPASSAARPAGRTGSSRTARHVRRAPAHLPRADRAGVGQPAARLAQGRLLLGRAARRSGGCRARGSRPSRSRAPRSRASTRRRASRATPPTRCCATSRARSGSCRSDKTDGLGLIGGQKTGKTSALCRTVQVDARDPDCALRRADAQAGRRAPRRSRWSRPDAPCTTSTSTQPEFGINPLLVRRRRRDGRRQGRRRVPRRQHGGRHPRLLGPLPAPGGAGRDRRRARRRDRGPADALAHVPDAAAQRGRVPRAGRRRHLRRPALHRHRDVLRPRPAQRPARRARQHDQQARRAAQQDPAPDGRVARQGAAPPAPARPRRGRAQPRGADRRRQDGHVRRRQLPRDDAVHPQHALRHAAAPAAPAGGASGCGSPSRSTRRT